MKYIIFIIILIFSQNIFSTECDTKINKGDTISQLLFNKNIKPIWGKKGYVNETRTLNKKDPNTIYPNEIWKMPKKYCNYVEINNDIIILEDIVVSEKKDNQSSHTIGIDLGFIYSKIKGKNNNGQGNYVSDLGKKYNFFWNIQHSHSWASQFNFGYQQIHWGENNILTGNRNQNLWDGSFQLHYIKNRLKYVYEVSFSEFPFYKAQSLTRNRMEKITVGSLNIGLEYFLLNSSLIDIFAGASIGYNYGLSNSVYGLDSGYIYRTYIKAERRIINEWNIFSTISYMNSQISNSDLKYDFTQLGLSLGINKSF